MVPSEKKLAKSVSRIFRAARKQLGLSQTTIASRLGISQSALSKLENGQFLPTALQWFSFCELTGISPNTFVTGYIERNRPALLEETPVESGFRIPERYSRFRGSKVRAMQPFLNFFAESFGESRLQEYLRACKLDEDYFVDLDNQLNLNFYLDLGRHLIGKGKLTMRQVPGLAKTASQPRVHGSLHRAYEGAASPVDLVTALVLQARQYECNFKYELKEQKASEVVFSVAPEAHLKEFGYRDDPELGNFLCVYKRAYFEQFGRYGGAAGGKITESQCHYRGARRCVYRFKQHA